MRLIVRTEAKEREGDRERASSKGREREKGKAKGRTISGVGRMQGLRKGEGGEARRWRWQWGRQKQGPF